MSSDQLKALQKLSQLFEEGIAGPQQIKLLSELLATINQAKETDAMDFAIDGKRTKHFVS